MGLSLTHFSTVEGFPRGLRIDKLLGSQPEAVLTILLLSCCSRLRANTWLVLIIPWRLRLLPSNWVTLVFKYFKHVNYFTEANKPTFWLRHLIRCFEWKPKCFLERSGKLLWNHEKASLAKSKRPKLFWFPMLRNPWSFILKRTILKYFRLLFSFAFVSRRPEITIVAAEPLRSSSWFPGASPVTPQGLGFPSASSHGQWRRNEHIPAEVSVNLHEASLICKGKKHSKSREEQWFCLLGFSSHWVKDYDSVLFLCMLIQYFWFFFLSFFFIKNHIWMYINIYISIL